MEALGLTGLHAETRFGITKVSVVFITFLIYWFKYSKLIRA